ncbi:hypothetical protein [Saccharospirillum mangrovi]|uniref:hypothetical protein n=1 Tax=Saccharospirillum mangrovi TaxID=2161747 RepID=UPI000D38F586|nr:hypothetical protein [Saccharospirillum mangrovi]
MLEPPIIVRIAVSIYLILGGVAAISLWRSAAAPDALQNSGIIIAGLLPALIAVLPYLKSSQLSENFELVLIFDEDARSVIPNAELDIYSRTYSNLYSNLDPINLLSREIGDDEVREGDAKQYWIFFNKEKGWDLIERLILLSFAHRFRGSWDIELSSRQTPTGHVIEGQYGDSESKEIRLDVIAKEMFHHNKIIQEGWMDLVPPFFHIPNGGTFTVEATSRSRIFTIKNRKATLKIDISPAGGEELHSLWGQYLPQNLNWAALYYRVEVSLTYQKYSTDGARYEQWFKNTANEIQQYDWNTIEENRQNELLRRYLENHQ